MLSIIVVNTYQLKIHACSLADPNLSASISVRLNAWNERKERGWEGDVPPIEGLSLREETGRLLAQVSRILHVVNTLSSRQDLVKDATLS